MKTDRLFLRDVYNYSRADFKGNPGCSPPYISDKGRRLYAIEMQLYLLLVGGAM